MECGRSGPVFGPGVPLPLPPLKPGKSFGLAVPEVEGLSLRNVDNYLLDGTA